MTYGEFLEWLQFLEWEEARQTKMDVYLAQIAAETRRSYVKHPRAVKVKDFIVSHQRATKGSAKASRSKQIWLSALKIKPEVN